VANHNEDRELALRMLAGDGAAFEAFAERYSRALYRFAQARLGGDREATREVVQTAMCKALAKLDSYRGEASLFTWLCACCRNEMLMRFRSRRTAPAEVELADDVEPAIGFGPGGAGGPEVALLEREAARRVHLALDLLPAHYARALEWKYLEDLPVQEIAARLNLGPKAAESLLTRARSAFRAGYESLRTRREVLPAGLDERVLSDG
jgi:RNA polymerase sigma-70 factor (ECF subfamily)